MKINKEIKAKNLKLIDENGNMLGFMSAKEAQKIAKDKNLDLVEMSPEREDTPSICKIMDYGKFRYQEDRKKKNNQKISKILKEVVFHFSTDKNDREVKKKQAISFLEKYSQVQINMVLRNYELELKDQALQIMKEIVEEMKPFGKSNTENLKLNGKVIKAVLIKN